MKELTPEYVAGLVDGEGSFTVYVRNPEAKVLRSRRVVVEPKFYLKLVERDKEVLYALADFFKCGSVYFQKDTRLNRQNCYRYEVCRWSDLTDVIIPFFRKHELRLVSKKNDFELFVATMSLLNEGVHKTASGLSQLFELKQRMH